MSPEMTFRTIAGFRMVTADPARLSTFYRAMGFDVGGPAPVAAAEMELLGVAGAGSRIAMRLGDSRVDLDRFDHPGRAFPSGSVACDAIFQHLALVTDDVEAAWRRAREAGATRISRARKVTLPASSGGVTAVKFRDPEGHPIEFLQFPSGATTSWMGHGIMGVDHSAITVRDIAASRRFYAGHGLTAGKVMVNGGPTQDVLDGLDGVEVDVLPMNPAHGPPHVELLGYRHPLGRETSPPTAVNDIAATRIVWWSDRDALLRDPDGHLHQLSRQDRAQAGTAWR